MADLKRGDRLRYSVSLVTQVAKRFHTLTMPSNILAKTCFVSTREEDPIKGFQRLLDEKRAKDIAHYIDDGLGSIPTSIVLSAQPEAELKVIGKGKTIEFTYTPKAFLILDGQHRVFGFSKTKTALRVPVVIYNGLSRKDESRLFIDINTKQRPVPSELLLDIKKLAEYDTDIEELLREIFDTFDQDSSSPLIGLLSPAKRSKNKISRTTFNAAVKPLVPIFADKEDYEIYEALSSYLTAFLTGFKGIDADKLITNPTVFRAVMQLFKEVGQRVKDRFGANYTTDNFYEVLEPMLSRISISKLKNPGKSYLELTNYLSNLLKTDFTL